MYAKGILSYAVGVVVALCLLSLAIFTMLVVDLAPVLLWGAY